MPPWFADPKCGHFSNERSLTESEIYTLWSWTAEGAPKGDLEDMPAPMNFTEGWGIPKPDVVLQLPKPFPVPESGMVGCQYVIVPPGFTERHLGASGRGPAHRACRGSPHHCFVREPGSNYFKDQKPEVFFEAPPAKTDEKTDTSALPSDFLVGYAPGQPAEMLQPGQGKLIKPGSDIVFEVHYTPNGKAVMDQTKLGLVLARETPKDRVQTLSASNGTFKIPRAILSTASMRRSKLPGRSCSRLCIPTCTPAAKISNIAWYFPTGRRARFCRCRPTTGTGSSGTTCRNLIVLPKGTKIECYGTF